MLKGHKQRIYRKYYLLMLPSWLLKSFEFANGSRISDEDLAKLEFKYLQNKKW